MASVVILAVEAPIISGLNLNRGGLWHRTMASVVILAVEAPIISGLNFWHQQDRVYDYVRQFCP